jgi:predicted dehydrogenase
MIHDIDIILRVVQSKVKNVAASGVSVVSESPDIANARLEFENGCVANLTASRLSLKNMRKARFFQQDAYVSVDFLNKELEVVRLDKMEGEADTFDLILPLGEGKNPRKLTINKPELQANNAIEEELKAFHHAVINKSNPLVNFTDGLQAMEVAHLIMEKLSSFQTKL